MYYEEAIIDGCLCWRGSPDDKWRIMSPIQLTKRLKICTDVINGELQSKDIKERWKI
jgi:hypothetical protein